MLHVSALMSHHINFKNYCFSVLSYSFLSYCIGDPFCITNHNYCLYGVRCPLLFVIGGGGFALVNLPVVLVYGYGRGSCHFYNFEPLYYNAAFGFKFSSVAEYYS